jgi:copper ion binding protein
MAPTTTTEPRDYTVHGMTCEHCVLTVREEVGDLAGVTSVEVDLSTGRLTVTGTADDTAIAAALAEAGYEVTA